MKEYGKMKHEIRTVVQNGESFRLAEMAQALDEQGGGYRFGLHCTIGSSMDISHVRSGKLISYENCEGFR